MKKSIGYRVSCVEYKANYFLPVFEMCKNTRYPIPDTRYSTRGFTLMETLVGMTVLIIAVTGTLSIISRNVSSAAIAKESITAFYLAQEAVEFVRGVRDNNAISGGGNWLLGLDDCRGGNKCAVDVNAEFESDRVLSCVIECPKLLLNTGTGVYGYGSGVDTVETVFTREVRLQDIAPDREERIDVTVKWQQGFVAREFTLSGTIFNWR